MHGTPANEPLKVVQQTQGQKGFDALRAIVRRCEQVNRYDTNSAYAALISCISERDRAKYVEHFDDILRTFVNKTNTFENRCGKNRDEEKMFAVKN